jgi:endo-1,3(4)-beta-glucanase
MTNGTYQWNGNGTEPDLMVFALPHHWDMMHDVVNSPGDSIYCAHSIIGPACLVAGGNWALVEALPNITLRANRRPAPWSIELLANSLEKDILYTLPHFFQRGAGDTYFSGKMLAKLGRILLINEELSEMCKSIASNKQKLTFDDAYTLEQYSDACEGASFPTEDVTSNAISSLRSSVEIWINGTAETPFVFDSSWGGVVSCGCLFDGKVCKNEFPDCPSFSDPGLNFGNAFYNDMHFHYGYHIYAAAVVAHFDSEWGSEFFERVLLLVRSIANPTDDDGAFPKCRHKDWYQGHSWASGIVNPPFRNGRNQESSSEAIAAYESVALFGTVMANIFRTNSSTEQLRSALEVENIGRLLTATEIRSTNRYWHVSLDDKVKIFPSEFTARVVGILWQAMAQFQTWFGSKPFLVYGIQLLPLTPISDYRDSIKWMKSIYYPLAQSCDSDPDCEKSGWSILELAVLATVGHQNLATERALKVPSTVFESAGGNGHSLTNTLWFIATREQLTEPLPLKEGQTAPDTENDNLPVEFDLVDCYKPESCTEYVLDTIVDSYTCRQRIQWLMNNLGKSQKDACVQVASLEYYDVCGKCNPYAETKPKEDSGSESSICPPCSLEECSSDLNRCPTYEHTYVCSAGMNRGGCLSYNWDLESGECNACCELTNCLSVKPVVLEMKDKVNEKSDDSCPPCSAEVCRNSKIQCPSDFSAPYVCSEGESFGGCSPRPWSLENKQCKKCCKLFPACDE